MNQHGCCGAWLRVVLVCCLGLQTGCSSNTEPERPAAAPAGNEAADPPSVDPAPLEGAHDDRGVDTGNPGRQPAQDPPDRDWPTGLAELVASDPAVRATAAERFARNPPDREVALEMWAGGTDNERQGAGFFFLSQYQGGETDIELAARKRLGDPDAKVRRLALDLVKRFGPEAWQTHNLELLLTGLLVVQQEPNEGIRAEVARVLASRRSVSESSRKVLFDVARKDPESQVRKAALYASTRVANVAAILPLLKDVVEQEQDAAVKRIAVSRIGRLGTQARQLVPQLGTALNSTDEALSDSAAKALAAMGRDAVPELVKHLGAESSRTRRLAIFSLAAIGSAARPAIPALEQRLQDEDEEVRQLAEMALRSILVNR